MKSELHVLHKLQRRKCRIENLFGGMIQQYLISAFLGLRQLEVRGNGEPAGKPIAFKELTQNLSPLTNNTGSFQRLSRMGSSALPRLFSYDFSKYAEVNRHGRKPLNIAEIGGRVLTLPLFSLFRA